MRHKLTSVLLTALVAGLLPTPMRKRATLARMLRGLTQVLQVGLDAIGDEVLDGAV